MACFPHAKARNLGIAIFASGRKLLKMRGLVGGGGRRGGAVFILYFVSGRISPPYLIVPTRYVQSQQLNGEVASMSAKYVFVTGGVVSSLGKGLAAASIRLPAREPRPSAST